MSTEVRSAFCAAGPPTRAPGTAAASRSRRWWTSVAVRESSTGVDPVTRTTVRPDAAVEVTTRASTTPACRRRDLDDRGCVGGGRGDEDWSGGAGAEGLHEPVVTVSARMTLVDDAGPRHAEVDPDRREHQRTEQHDPDGEDGAGPTQRHARPAGPSALGHDVRVLLAPRHEHAVAQRDEECGQQRQRRERDRDDGEDHPQGHRAEHHHGHEEHGCEREHDCEGGEEHRLAGGGQRVLDRGDRVLAFDPFLSVAADDEQAVVDADGETDHHREVHRPHRQRGRHPEQMQQREARPRCPPCARRSGRTAAITDPNAKNSRIIVGMPLTSSALCSASLVHLVEVAPHRPLTRHVSVRTRTRASDRPRRNPGRRPRRGATRPDVTREVDRNDGRPTVAGDRVRRRRAGSEGSRPNGHGERHSADAPVTAGRSGRSRSASTAGRRRPGSRRRAAGKSFRSSSRTFCAVEPCASHPAPDSAPVRVSGERRRRERDDKPHGDDDPRGGGPSTPPAVRTVPGCRAAPTRNARSSGHRTSRWWSFLLLGWTIYPPGYLGYGSTYPMGYQHQPRRPQTRRSALQARPRSTGHSWR